MDPISAHGASLLLGLLIAPELSVPWWCWALVAAGAAWVRTPRPHLGTLQGCPIALALGLACGATVRPGPELDGPVAVIGVRVGAASGRTGDVALTNRLVDGEWRAAEGRVRVVFTDAAPGPGRAVVVRGSAHPIDPALPGAPDPVRAARLAGIRTAIDAGGASVIGGSAPAPIEPELDPTGLMRAILLGDRRGVAPETNAVLQRTGTTHLLSISGFHVGAAAWLLEVVLGRWVRAIGVVWRTGVPRGALVAAGIAGSWLYTALAEWPVPAERAAALLTVALVARAGGRTVVPERWLWWIAGALAILEPGSPATASYQLSFGAMFGLVWFAPWITRWFPPGVPWPTRWAIDGLGATFGATLGTLPFAAWWFQAVPPWSAVANLVALPTLGLALVPLAAAVALLPSPLREGAAVLGTALCRAVLVVLAPMSVDPWTPAVTAVGALLLGAALIAAVRWPVQGTIAAAAVLAGPIPRPDHLRITILAVGQGDAALVEWPDGRRWLVDGGPARSDVLFWLRRRGVRRLDRVVQTHPDRDHARGLIAVVANLDVGELVAADLDPDLAAAAEARRIPIRTWPAPAGLTDNDRSLWLAVGPVFLAGDLEARGERAAAAAADRTFAVLKVAHHGSATSSTAPLLDRLGPAVAIVSVGPHNLYGHPSPEVLERFDRRGIEVFRTDRDGTVVIDVTDAISVRTW